MRICDFAQAPPSGRGVCFQDPSGRHWALFNDNGTFHLFEDRCPHMDFPIHDGDIRRGIVTCPWHHWQFDVQSGACLLHERIRLSKLEVQVDEGVIYALWPKTG